MLNSSFVLFLICFGIFMGLVVAFLCLMSLIPYGALMWKLFPVFLIICLVLGGIGTGIGTIIKHRFNSINVVWLAILSDFCIVLICGFLYLGKVKMSKNSGKVFEIVSSTTLSEQDKLTKLKNDYRLYFMMGHSFVNSRVPISQLTLLHVAAENGELEIVKFLLNHGADVNIPSQEGTILGKAVKSGNPEIVKLILEKGANVNEKYYRDRTALMDATFYKNPEIIKLLLAYGANADQ